MSLLQSQEGDADPATRQLEAIAQRLLIALGTLRVMSLSFHDEDADVLWLNESVLGPDEHEALRASMEVFAGQGAPARYEYDLGDGRVAVTWRANHAGSSVLGVLMMIVDKRALSDPKLRLSSNCVDEAVLDFSTWLSADMSATQLRLRALPDLSASAPPPEEDLPLSLVDYVAPAPAAPASAPPPPPPPSNVTHIDPMLDRHFSALRAQPIVLYAQQLEPMAAGSRIPRYEILLRTGSEHGRTQAPVAMLEAAARKGLGSVLDRRVITELLVWLARSADTWHASPIAVTVNLSSTSLIDPHFLKFVELCLEKSGLPRGMIGFELDAMLCTQHAQRASEFAEVLAALGCKVVLDNFSLNEGHVNLLGLKGLRMLKLHPQLTNAIATDKCNQAVVAGIAQMACVLGMHTCAKAVESNQNQALLAALKVDFAQGFAFSIPRPLAELNLTGP